jgi:nitrogen fixation NifU-like protein
MQYTEKVMDHFMNPRNVGVIENPDGYGKIGSPSCGDMMEIFLKVENEVITDVKFRTFGCASAIASSSITTEMILNKTVDEALEVTNKAVVEALGGLPAAKVHCSVLAEEAIKAAIEDYISKRK